MDYKARLMLIINAVMLVVLLVGIFLLVRNLRAVRNESRIGEEAPAFAYTTLDGLNDDLYHPRDHGWVTLFVFSADCPHCGKVAPLWNELVATDSGNFGTVVGLSISPVEETAVFMYRHKTQFPVYLISKSFMEGYHISGVPTTITIYRGIIRRIIEGIPTESDMAYLTSIHRKGIGL